MASSLRAASSNVANRTVHVKIFPSARTFAERREVLRVLERFGEVNMFKSLKHHPISPIQNAFISIFNSETAAQELINASPVRYRLIVEPNPTLPNNVNPSATSTSTQSSKPIEKIFSLSLNISRYTHDQYISHPLTNPLFGPFKPIDPKRSGIAAHLGKNIEGRIWSKGLVDWESDSGRRSGWNEEEKEGRWERRE
ncbi:1e537c95-a35e-466a-8a0f-773a93266a80 [Sclerotinia trifoliorum]|uniref:1e537c95-a35e-466a-8a0f-773a93266a80 n=1 Tax=Sclerotinia trifoliorum TaxID=28548 RepID=A0A8H2VQJ6_9HELO|nr:1e537c95-a35e-466a-8a0f-773a93266a80 [Sclerotinia trifoliorum]